MSFKRQGKWIVLSWPLRTRKERLEAMNDAVFTCCFSGSKKLEKQGQTLFVSPGKQYSSPYIFSLSLARLTPSKATFLYEPFVGYTVEDYAILTPFEFSQAVRIAKHMCKAVAFIHALDFFHRNINPDSFVVVLGNKEGKAKATAKLWKFGNARPLRPSGMEIVPATKTDYTAPEDMGNLGHEDLPRADVYSLGATLRYLLSRAGKEKTVRPKELRLFLKKMMAKDPRKRPTAVEAVDFFEQI